MTRQGANGFERHPLLEPIEILDFVRLQGRPVLPQEWIVPRWVPANGKVTGIQGSGGSGKTLLAQMLGTAAVIGKPWFGLPVKPVRVLGLFCEDDEGDVHRRQAAINQHYGCEFSDLEDMHALPRLGHDNSLMHFDGIHPEPTPFFYQLRTAAIEFGAELVLVDTVADVFTGNQNDSGHVRTFVQHALGRLARDIRGSVVAVGHPSRAGQNDRSGESGSVQWDATCRSRLYLERAPDSDTDARVLTRKKSNYAARDETMELQWQTGVFVRIDQPALSGIFASIERRKEERVFVELLDKLESEGRPVSASRNAGNFAPKIFASRPAAERQGLVRGDFHRAMEALFSDNSITTAPYGPPSAATRKIIRVAVGREAVK